jgi:hypothetical protein
MEPDIQLGDIAKDTVTGYEGTVIGRTEWLNGCWRLTIQAKMTKKDTAPSDGYSFDSQQCVLVKRGTHKAKKETGGPRPSVRQTGL